MPPPENHPRVDMTNIHAWPYFVRKLLLVLAELAFIGFWIIMFCVTEPLQGAYDSWGIEPSWPLSWFIALGGGLTGIYVTGGKIGILVGWLVVDWLLGSLCNRFLTVAYAVILFVIAILTMGLFYYSWQEPLNLGRIMQEVEKRQEETDSTANSKNRRTNEHRSNFSDDVSRVRDNISSDVNRARDTINNTENYIVDEARSLQQRVQEGAADFGQAIDQVQEAAGFGQQPQHRPGEQYRGAPPQPRREQQGW